MIMLNQILLKAPKHRIAMENKVQNILVQLYLQNLQLLHLSLFQNLLSLIYFIFVIVIWWFFCYKVLVTKSIASLCETSSFKMWLMDIPICTQKPTPLKTFNCFSSCINTERGLNPSMSGHKTSSLTLWLQPPTYW